MQFQDTAEKKDNLEQCSPRDFCNIKPESSLSAVEAKSFVESLFAVGLEDMDLDEIEEAGLWADIFERSEDEFRFDFEVDDEIRAVLEHFDSEKWDNLSEGERMEAIYELADVMGEKLGLYVKPEVKLYDGRETSCGFYSHSDNSINLNQRHLPDSWRTVDTVAHELRHAYQKQRAEIQETWMDNLYKLNYEHYIHTEYTEDGKCVNFMEYQDQLLEAEARAFASLFKSKEGV